MNEREIVDQFHRLYYRDKTHTWGDTRWFGVPIQKCPLDLWIYQEILFEVRPEWIVETGSAAGGSALYLAHLCDLLGNGRVLSIDFALPSELPKHPRLQFIQGDSVGATTLTTVRTVIGTVTPVLVILDSDHHRDHVKTELEAYSPFVTVGSYLIVEDTNLNGHPVAADFGPGPAEAIADFLKTTRRFRPDPTREKFLVSANIGGYLRRTDEVDK